MKKDILIATNLSLITGLGLSACKAVGIAPFSPTPESGANSHEFTPTPESDIYPTHFAWMDGRNEVVQKVMAEYGLSSSDIKGFEITVSGLLSATDVHDEKVQFINFIDPNTGLNVSAYYDSKNPNGLLNDFETINRGGGLFVERQLVDLNDPNNYHTLLIISVDAEEKLKSGESTTIEFNPPEWVRAYMPALDPSKNLVINVPIIPELTTTASLGIIPEFLVIDGSVEGIQTPTPSPESLLPQEVKEKFELAGIDLSQMQNAEYDKDGLHITLESGEVIVLTNTDLQKGIYLGQDNVLKYRGEFNDSPIYSYDKESGKWGVATEIVLTPSGIGFELGEQIEGQPEGVRKVTDIVLPEIWDDEKQADYETRIDPTTYGFAEGETRLAYIPTEDGKYRVELQRTSNPADVIAVFGSNDFVWKISEMVDDNGDPVFLNVGNLVEVSGRTPKNRGAASSAALNMTNSFVKIKYNQLRHQLFIFISKDGNSGVQVNFSPTGDSSNEGFLYFRNQKLKILSYIFVEDFDENMSFVEALH